MTSLPVCHFRYDVTPHLHQSPFIPKSRGWLLSQSEPSHHNEALFPLFGHSFMTSLPVFHVRYDVTPRLHQSPSTPKSRGWLLSKSEPLHQHSFLTSLPVCHFRHDVTPRLHQSPKRNWRCLKGRPLLLRSCKCHTELEL